MCKNFSALANLMRNLRQYFFLGFPWVSPRHACFSSQSLSTRHAKIRLNPVKYVRSIPALKPSNYMRINRNKIPLSSWELTTRWPVLASNTANGSVSFLVFMSLTNFSISLTNWKSFPLVTVTKDKESIMARKTIVLILFSWQPDDDFFIFVCLSKSE